jgi:hypothetical protein
LISNRTEESQGAAAVIHFSAVLMVAVFVVALTEWFRDTIRGETPGLGEPRESRRSLSAILSSVLLLAVFEVCVLAYEEVSQATFETPYAVKELAARVSGKEIPYAFLRTTDIVNPHGFVDTLRDAYRQRTSLPPSPAGWVAEQLGPEVDWTLFPDDAPRPQRHDAFAAHIAAADPYVGLDVRQPGLPDPPAPSAAPVSLSGAGKGKPANAPRPSLQVNDDYNALLLKVDLLASLDANELKPDSQIQATRPPSSADEYHDFVPHDAASCNLSDPTCEPPWWAGVRALSNATRHNMSEGHLRDLLVVELNKLLLSPEFYNEDEFRRVTAPEGVKQLLSREREDYIDYTYSASQLQNLKTLPESEACEDQFADLRAKTGLLDGRLLPLPRVVELNRALLTTAFSEYVMPAPERFDDHGANLAVLGLLWMFAGGALGWILAAGIFDRSGPGEHPSRRGALRGLVAALGAAPVMVVLYVLTVRLWALVRDAWHFQHELHYLWEPHSFPPDDLFDSSLVPALLRLYGYWHHKWLAAGVVAVVALLLATFFQWTGRVRGMSKASRWLLFGLSLMVLALVALVFDGNLPYVYLLVALVWITPAVIIGMCGPNLRTGSPMPQTWGLIAVLAGLGLVLATLLRLKWDSISPWLLVPGVVLIATGLLMRAGLRLEEYWPLGALALGLAVCVMSAAVQQATFLGVLSDVHELNANNGYDAKLWPEVPTRELQARQTPPLITTRYGVAPASGCGTAVPQLADDITSEYSDLDHSPPAAAPKDTTRLPPPAQASQPGPPKEGDQGNAYDEYFTGPLFYEGHPQQRENELKQTLSVRMNQFSQNTRGMASTGDFSTDNLVLTRERDDQERLRSVRGEVARRLELSIVGSLGFWLTVGLLAGWALQRNSTEASEARR